MNDRHSWVISDTFTEVEADQHLVLWNEFIDSDSPHTSLPTIIRDERSHFRDQVLKTLDELAAFQVGGRSLSKALELEEGLSYLHMTLVWAKRWGELGVLANAVKMLALTERLRTNRPSYVAIRLEDKTAASCIANTCARMGITCDSATVAQRTRLRSIRAIRHLLRCFSLSASPNNSTGFIIADYLFRTDPRELMKGNFRSGYWSTLPETLENTNTTITWLHRFVPHPAIPTHRAARRALRRLPHHHLLDQIHGVRELVSVWRMYRRISRLNIDARAAFVAGDCDLWPIFENEWNESFRGSHPMSQAIVVCNLQRILSNNDMRNLLYIYENQPWEFALRYFAGAKCESIAVPHATVRFWDLRYFVGAASRHLLPRKVAVNSGIAKEELLRGGYPPTSLHDVEALMYQYPQAQVRSTAQRDGILVLGELEIASSQRYLDWVIRLANHHTITFKPHPLTDASQFTFDAERVSVSSENSNQLIAAAEIVVLGASGTATLEAIALGVPVVSVLNPRELDLSAVRDHPLVRLVATEADFAVALRDSIGSQGQADEVFFLDPHLARWKQLLELA